MLTSVVLSFYLKSGILLEDIGKEWQIVLDYLFFDIECANCDGGNGKICSFGYTLADSDLNEIITEDIIINPKAPFRLQKWGKRYIELAYPEAQFRRAPAFPEYYKTISEMLTKKDRMVFGYAPENDAGFVRSECERYGLAMPEFRFYDVQRIYKAAIGTESGNLCSLSSACEGLGLDTDFTSHKSCDDAKATMDVLKKICTVKAMSPKEVTEKFTPCEGQLKDGEVKASYFRPKTELKPGEENMIKGVNKDDFRYITRRASNKNCLGKKICFSWIYEFYHFKEMVKIVCALTENGYRYTHKTEECDIFVRKPENTGGICKRSAEINARNEEGKGKKAEIIGFDEFLETVGLTEETLKTEASKVPEYIKKLKKGNQRSGEV